eukprot:EST44046.1 Hypothetical protein SS50377_16359 [Spironucleus salmonicida]
MTERFIKQEQVYSSEQYDMHYAYDTDTGRIVYWYDIKQKLESILTLFEQNSHIYSKILQSTYISPSYPGNYLNIILNKQKQYKLQQNVLIKWIFSLHQELMSKPILNPSLENIFVNTRDSKAFFSLNSYIKSPLIDFQQPQSEFISHTEFITFLNQIQQEQMKPYVLKCDHKVKSCLYCKQILVAYKIILDNQQTTHDSFQQIYEAAIQDIRLKSLFAIIKTPHCQNCCLFSYYLSSPKFNELVVQNTSRFLFGCTLVQIFNHNQIINYALLNALMLLKIRIPITVLFPLFFEMPKLISTFILEFFDGQLCFESLQINPLFSQEFIVNDSICIPVLSCEYKNKRQNTMTIIWNNNGKKVNQYIMVDDSLDTVADACFIDSLLPGVSKIDIYRCLKDKGSWQ